MLNIFWGNLKNFKHHRFLYIEFAVVKLIFMEYYIYIIQYISVKALLELKTIVGR